MAVALGDWAAGDDELFGDLLALVGAVAAGAYFLIGRRVRRSLSNVSYIALVYLGAALALMAAVGTTATPLAGFGTETYWILILIALVPQILGHSSLNWALGHLSATLVAVAVMAPPSWPGGGSTGAGRRVPGLSQAGGWLDQALTYPIAWHKFTVR